jgi:hypothetical protein
MIDIKRVPHFRPRHLREYGISAEPDRPKREPRTGRDDPCLDAAAIDQLPETGLDKYPVLGLQ